MMTYMVRLNVVKMDCMVVICFLLQILLTQALEGIQGYQVRFVIPPSCRSGFVLRDPEDKLILQLSSIHSSYSAGITVSHGCHDTSDPGGCVVKGTVSTLGVYRVRPNDAGNVGCYKSFNVTACREGMFQCRDGNCVEGNMKCDGTPQCEDWSDEDGCPTPNCPASDFQCASTVFRNIIGCIDRRLRCDGYTDCRDGSDEDDCQDPSEDVNTMATNRSDNSMVTKGYSNVEVNTAVTEQDKRVTDTGKTTNSPDITMVTKDYHNVEVNTAVTEQGKRVTDSIATTNSPDIAMVTKHYHNVEVNTAVTEQGKRVTDSIATTNSPDIAMVTKHYHNVEVNTAVTEQGKRVTDSIATTNSSDIAMVTTEVYTKVTERDIDNQQNSIIAIVLAVVVVVLVAEIVIVSVVFIRKSKRKRKRRDVQPEDPPATNTLDNKVYDPDMNSIYAEIDNCVIPDESQAYDYVTNIDLLTKQTTSADYITPAGCNDKDLKTQATSSDDYYLVPLNKRNPVYEALGDKSSDQYTTLDRQNMNMYENRRMFRKQHHF